MAKPILDIAAEIARLESLTIDQLRYEWRRLHQTPPPKRLSRDIARADLQVTPTDDDALSVHT